MKLPERHDAMVKAEFRISGAIVSAYGDLDLTYTEVVAILASQIASWTRRQMRAELHKEEP